MANKEKGTNKLRSAFALKRGGYAIAFTAIIVAAVIVINVLATALTKRFPLNIDLTANNDYSVSSKNIDYIRGVSRPVTITVCATEENYSSYMTQYASYYYNATDSTNGKYFTQALTLLDEYKKFNDNIKVVFADPESPDFSEIQARVGANSSLSFGSILVESTFELDGQDTYRSKVLSFDDLYDIEDTTGGYAAYYGSGNQISGSKVETAVTSAIYSVTSDKTTQVGYVSARMDTSVLDGLNSTLADNNYNVTAIDNLLGFDIDSNIEVLVIAAPTSDYSAEELNKIDKFLDNDGERGKTLLFFASSASPNLPNLYDFLSEWGISYTSGSVYETNSNNYVKTPYTIGLANKSSDFTASVNNINRMYIAGNNVPLKVGFTTQGNRTTTELLSTSETVVARPLGSGDDWSADNETKTTFSAAILSCDKLYNQDYSEKSSYVVGFSSVDFVSSSWQSYTGTVGNMEMTVGVLNLISGRDADTVTFTNKTITIESFAESVTGFGAIMARIIFIGLIPLAVIVIGIVIWFRRKNK